MARKRKFPRPRFLTTIADTASEAEVRRKELHKLGTPTGGRAYRVDRLREAMTIADQVPRPRYQIALECVANRDRHTHHSEK